jgi:glycosyltransferase involved in cell wall biosynthesis
VSCSVNELADSGSVHPDLEPLPGCRSPGPNILFVGRLEERRGFTDLLRAFGEVLRARPDARLLVAGAYGAREGDRYAAIAARLGIRNVSFVGPLARPELARTSPARTSPGKPETRLAASEPAVARPLRIAGQRLQRGQSGRPVRGWAPQLGASSE